MQEQTETIDREVKIEIFERPMPVAITDKERRELSDRTARLLDTIEEMTEDQKAVAKQGKAQIEERKAELKRVRNEYSSGKKMAPVKCERRFIYRTNTYQEVRTDTGEIMHERPLSERERQTELPGIKGNGKAQASDADDPVVDDDYKTDGETEPPLATAKKRKVGGRKRKGS